MDVCKDPKQFDERRATAPARNALDPTAAFGDWLPFDRGARTSAPEVPVGDTELAPQNDGVRLSRACTDGASEPLSGDGCSCAVLPRPRGITR